MKTIKVYDIEWECDELFLSGLCSHTGEKYGHLLSDAEDEQEELPTEISLEVEEGADPDDLYHTIEGAANAFYCQCVGYKVEDEATMKGGAE